MPIIRDPGDWLWLLADGEGIILNDGCLQSDAPKCACAGCASRRASRRAFVAATGLVPLLFFRDESSAAPSPTNVDDMEARKMAREEILKAARAKAAAQAAAEAGTAAPAPAPASG